MSKSAPDPALESLLRDNYALIHAVCRRVLNNNADADDATQNAMISIVKNFSSFDGRSAFSTWAYRIATNAALDELRRRQRRPLSLVSNDQETLADIRDGRSAEPFSDIESRDEITQALAMIPEQYRVTLVLRDVADLEYDEIASILNIPVGTVRSRIARGRAKLADILGNSASPAERLN